MSLLTKPSIICILTSIAADTVFIDAENVTVTAYKSFDHASFDGDLNMKDKATINDVDVSELNKNGIHLSSDGIINDTVIFSSNVTFLSGLHLKGQLNKENLSNVLFSNEAAVITGAKTFNSDIGLSGNLDVDGTVNGIDISGNCYFCYFLLRNS